MMVLPPGVWNGLSAKGDVARGSRVVGDEGALGELFIFGGAEMFCDRVDAARGALCLLFLFGEEGDVHPPALLRDTSPNEKVRAFLTRDGLKTAGEDGRG